MSARALEAANATAAKTEAAARAAMPFRVSPLPLEGAVVDVVENRFEALTDSMVGALRSPSSSLFLQKKKDPVLER
jgi:hypothetical protein